MMISLIASIIAFVVVGGISYLLVSLMLRRHGSHAGASRLPKLAELLVSLLALVACFITGGIVDNFTNPASPEKQVCAGKAFPSAAAYEGASIHPMMLATEHGEIHFEWQSDPSEWVGLIPSGWLAGNPEEMQLVACVEEQLVTIEVCEYTGGSDITRYRIEAAVRLIEARTGSLIAEQTFQGSQPRSCRYTEDRDLKAIYGDPVSLTEVQAWLEEYVQGSE